MPVLPAPAPQRGYVVRRTPQPAGPHAHKPSNAQNMKDQFRPGAWLSHCQEGHEQSVQALGIEVGFSTTRDDSRRAREYVGRAEVRGKMRNRKKMKRNAQNAAACSAMLAAGSEARHGTRGTRQTECNRLAIQTRPPQRPFVQKYWGMVRSDYTACTSATCRPSNPRNQAANQAGEEPRTRFNVARRLRETNAHCNGKCTAARNVSIRDVTATARRTQRCDRR